MTIEELEKNGYLFEGWHVIRFLGEGSYGKVYEIEREEFGTKIQSALKVISIPKNKNDIKELMTEGMDEESASMYFRGFVEDFVRECQIMSNLKGNSFIVSFEDYKVVEHKDEIGWDILIRMEMLTPFVEYLGSHRLSKDDVLKLGISVCKALELCEKQNIIHRDIKPANIFVSQTGDYKLGDFGIARIISKTTGASTKVGTNDYMAPEVYRGEIYGKTVDIYSLGLVLYRLLNNNRMPFLPPAPAPITHSQREEAVAKRMQGIEFPNPVNADDEVVNILKKATTYKPEDRYQDPHEMREELEHILTGNHHSRIEVEDSIIEEEPETETSVLTDDDEKTELFENEATSVAPIVKEENNLDNTSEDKVKTGKTSLAKWLVAILIIILITIVIVAIKQAKRDKSSYVADEQEYIETNEETEQSTPETTESEVESEKVVVKHDLKGELLNKSGASESDIVMLHEDDFDGDGKEEAFAIIDNNTDFENGELVKGSIWFVGYDSCVKILESEEAIINPEDRIMKLGDIQYILFNEEPATGMYTYAWYVTGSRVQQAVFSGVGGIVMPTIYGDFRIVHNSYDALYDPINNITTGHTWKSYYFYYDESDKQIYEYAGTPMDVETAKQYCGTYLTDLLMESDQVDGYLWHDNGLIVMNFERADGTDVRYYHYILDICSYSLIDDSGKAASEEPLEGVYLRTIISTMARYPEVPDV